MISAAEPTRGLDVDGARQGTNGTEGNREQVPLDSLLNDQATPPAGCVK